MKARREKGIAMRSGDGEAREIARQTIDATKIELGERGPVWWDQRPDGSPDYNRHLAKNTPYADWFASLQP
jgi:hypothetical protein